MFGARPNGNGEFYSISYNGFLKREKLKLYYTISNHGGTAISLEKTVNQRKDKWESYFSRNPNTS